MLETLQFSLNLHAYLKEKSKKNILKKAKKIQTRLKREMAIFTSSSYWIIFKIWIVLFKEMKGKKNTHRK